MLWGGLRPIPSRIALDSITLGCLTFCTLTSSAQTIAHGIVLLTTIVFHLATTGLTNRWTITLPMMPLAVLQIARRFSLKWENSIIITCICLFLVLVAALLCVLFPAVELPPIKGKYNVGVVDLFLPIKSSSSTSGQRQNGYQNGHRNGHQNGNSQTEHRHDNNNNCNDNYNEQEYVTAQILYPTVERPDGSVFHVDPILAKDFCQQSMRFGAPPPLNQFGWILHTWRLMKLGVKRNAKLADHDDDGEPFPMVVYSHGLGGNYSVYSYQTMMLAASGAVVLALDHSDGSAPVMVKHDGTRIYLDFNVAKLWYDGKRTEYVRARRALNNVRVKEFLAATEAFLSLNERNIPELESVGLSLVNQLNPRQLHFAGHSFGAATALTAGYRRADLPQSILAHDPAVDWLPDDTRQSLFADDRLAGSKLSYDGGTGGYEQDNEPTTPNIHSRHSSSIHDIDLLFLYSEQWMKLGWGQSHQVQDMFQRGVLGSKGGFSEFGVIS